MQINILSEKNSILNRFRKNIERVGEIFAYEISKTFEYKNLDYLAPPSLILADPMLATASSMVLTYKELLKTGNPKHTHIVSIIASTEGLEYIKKNISTNISLWLGVIDNDLTASGYLGDADDLAFGPKED